MSVYKIDNEAVENGERKWSGSIKFDTEAYFNEYNELYGKLIPAALKTALDRHAVKAYQPSLEMITTEADLMIQQMLEKRERALDSKVRDFNLVWDDSAPEVF